MDEIDAMVEASGPTAEFIVQFPRACRDLGVDGEDLRRLLSQKEFSRIMVQSVRHKVRFGEGTPFSQGREIPDEGFRTLYFYRSSPTVDMLLDAVDEEGYRLLTEGECARAQELMPREISKSEMATLRLLNTESEVYEDQVYNVIYLNREKYPVPLLRPEEFGRAKPHYMLVRLASFSEAQPPRLLQMRELAFGDLDLVQPIRPPRQWAVVWLRNQKITVGAFRALLHANGFRFFTLDEQWGINRSLISNRVPRPPRPLQHNMAYGFTESPGSGDQEFTAALWYGSHGPQRGVRPEGSAISETLIDPKCSNVFFVVCNRPYRNVEPATQG